MGNGTIDMIIKLVEMLYKMFFTEDKVLMDWSLKLFQWGLDFWNSAYDKVVGYITLNPRYFMGLKTMTGITALVNALSDIGGELCVFIFLAGVLMKLTDIKQLKNFETILSLLIRLIVSNSIVRYGLKTVVWVVDFAQDIINSIAAAQGLTGSGLHIPPDLFDSSGEQLPFLNLLALIATVVSLFFIIILAMYMVIIVYGRFFEVLVLMSFSPISLSFFSAEFTQQYAIGYLKYLFGAVLKGGVILIAGYIFEIVVNNGAVFTTGSDMPVAIYIVYIVNVIFYMLVFVLTAKTADTVVQRALGG